jgi:RNA polymerase sigma factor (sigma-70 family)
MGMDFAALSHNALISFIVCHPDDNQAWVQFIERFNLFVYATISRECKKRGPLSAAVTCDDLAQEVYVKVLKGLKDYKGRYEKSCFLYLAIIAQNTVKNHFRQQHAAGRPQEEKRISLYAVRTDTQSDRPMPLNELLSSEDWAEQERLTDSLQQIEHCLQKILNSSRHKMRDELIFHYYFVCDIGVERIATYPEVHLSQQRVFGVLNDFKKRIKDCLERLERED